MKGLVLARGLARRMREADARVALPPDQAQAAEAGLKALIPIGGAHDASASAPRPFLDYILDVLADAGCLDIGVVIGPEHAAIRERYAGANAPRRIALSWIEQAEPRGTADAVLAAEGWAGTHPFLVVNGDNLYPVEVLRALVAIDGPGLAAFDRDDLARSGTIPADRVAAFALIQRDDAGSLTGMIEKPDETALGAAGAHALVSMNAWRFDARIFDACRAVPLSARGEYELPDAAMIATTRGVRFRAIDARGEVLDLSRRADIATVSARLAGRTPRL